MSDNITREDMSALQAQIDAVTGRLAALEGAGQSRRTPRADGTDYVDTFGSAMIERVRQTMDTQNAEYGLAVSNIITQVGRKGSKGTAFSIVTVDKPDDLPSDALIAERVARVALLVQDPLAMRIFRSLIALRFAGRPMRASAAELASALAETPDGVEAALAPLVASGVVQRALAANGTVEYEWDGNNHIAMTILFRA
jgi:hypothetical protein